MAKGKSAASTSTGPSSNWLALQKKLPGSPHQSHTLHEGDTRPHKKAKKRHEPQDLSMEIPEAAPVASSSSLTLDSPPVEGGSGMKNGESVPWLRNMILGHVEYTPAQLLPGKYLSLDCEMVGVGLEGKESSLARVSLVNYYGAVQLDEFVRQRERVVNYRTEFSGIRPSDMVKAKPFAEVQKQVADLLKDRILVGHAVFNDLKALLLTHPGTHTRDTQGYAGKHKVTSSRRPALRHLIQQEFGLAIQSGEHSSVTDARATMAVYRLHRKHWEKGNRPIASEPATPSAKSGKNKNKRKRVEREDGDGVSADEDPLLKVFPGGGRKGISSGLSVVVKRAGVKESKVAHGGRGDRRSVGVGGTKTQSEWWKDLGSSGSKGSIRL